VTAVVSQPSDTAVADARLRCRAIAAGHNGVPCVRSFDLTVAPRTVLALVGPNGAGKTTLLMTLAGFLPRLHGDVMVDGAMVKSGSPRDAAAKGIVLVPDDRALFPGLTVAENLEAARRRGGPDPRDILDLFPVLQARWRVAAGNVSGGEQQMLAVARALMRDPRVLLIDELSMGLAPVVVERVLPAVRRVADELGAAVVLVEQHVHLALEIADRAVVLVHGEVVQEGSADELAADMRRLETAYLGDPTVGPADRTM
jgi:branched-chain amino acid transport system ATP-binding protein